MSAQAKQPLISKNTFMFVSTPKWANDLPVLKRVNLTDVNMPGIAPVQIWSPYTSPSGKCLYEDVGKT